MNANNHSSLNIDPNLAYKIRLDTFGNKISFSPKVFIPLTRLCLDRCGYCNFAKSPSKTEPDYLAIDEVLTIATKAEQAGCHEALFTLGEKPELRYSSARKWLKANRFDSTVEYLYSTAKAVVEQTGLLVHSNAGALDKDELLLMRKVSASQGMMIETLNPSLPSHRLCPDKTPLRRLKTLEEAGKASIAFTTGILIGIGESRQDRIQALQQIADSYNRWGHIQEVIIQNFLPKPKTLMRNHLPCPNEELAWSIAAARQILPKQIHIQAPPNLQDDFSWLLKSGIDDWGGISPLSPDYVNLERPWPQIEKLSQISAKEGFELISRLTIYPEFINTKWLDPNVMPSVLKAMDSQGYARESKWYAGGNVEVPKLILNFKPCSNSAVQEVLNGVELGQEVGLEEIITLFSARGREIGNIAELADDLRKKSVGSHVTWVANRNINYTNICTFKCRFCAFSKGPSSLNLRGKPYLLSLEQITEKVLQAQQVGATEVCLQGGIHPEFDGEFYLSVIKAIRKVSSTIHIHGFSALEITQGAQRLGIDIGQYLKELKKAGLQSLPGTAAEILDDEIRASICPDKITTQQWLDVHEQAHSIGLRSNVTIMFGTIESPYHWAKHLLATKQLQIKTGGFNEFVPLAFVHKAAPLFLRGKSRQGPTFREALLMHAIGRIVYNKYIDNIQISWVKMGIDGTRQLLQAGGNDLGGTLMEENISRAAGASHGQGMNKDDFIQLVKPLARHLSQRNTLYQKITTSETKG